MLILPFTCFLTCVAILHFIFMVYFPKCIPTPGTYVAPSFHQSVCLEDAHFPSMMSMTMTMMVEEHLAQPFPHPSIFLPYPLLQRTGSKTPGCCSHMLLSLSVTCDTVDNFFLPVKSALLGFCGVSSWCSSSPSALVNSITSWAYPCEAVLITSW